MEEDAEQADGVLLGQEDAEAPDEVLQDLCSTEVCGRGREVGDMLTLGYGLVYVGEGPLGANLDGEAMRDVLLKKVGGRLRKGAERRLVIGTLQRRQAGRCILQFPCVLIRSGQQRGWQVRHVCM